MEKSLSDKKNLKKISANSRKCDLRRVKQSKCFYVRHINENV